MDESTSAPVDGKTCVKCDQVKPLSGFGWRSQRRRNDCKACVAAYNRERYQRDPELRAKHKALRDRWRAENPTYLATYYQQNRETLIAAAVEYQKRNPIDPEVRRERERRWRDANAEHHAAVKKAWRAANPERVTEAGRRAQSARRARKRGLPTERYTMAQIIERDGPLCVLCGEELDLDAVHPDPLSPTVEHLECIAWPNSAGDVLTNVAVAHYRCNNQRRTSPHPAAARKRAELLAASG